MSVDVAAVDYWLKELVPAFTQVTCQLYQQCAMLASMLVLAQDLREAKRIIALLLVNELRNLGDLRHADPPHGWMWAERLSPDLLEHLQQLQNRARQHCNFVAPTAKKRARQISRCAPCLGRCVFTFACAPNWYRSPISEPGDAVPKKSAYIFHTAQLHERCRPYLCASGPSSPI